MRLYHCSISVSFLARDICCRSVSSISPFFLSASLSVAILKSDVAHRPPAFIELWLQHTAGYVHRSEPKNGTVPEITDSCQTSTVCRIHLSLSSVNCIICIAPTFRACSCMLAQVTHLRSVISLFHSSHIMVCFQRLCMVQKTSSYPYAACSLYNQTDSYLPECSLVKVSFFSTEACLTIYFSALNLESFC